MPPFYQAGPKAWRPRARISIARDFLKDELQPKGLMQSSSSLKRQPQPDISVSRLARTIPRAPRETYREAWAWTNWPAHASIAEGRREAGSDNLSLDGA